MNHSAEAQHVDTRTGAMPATDGDTCVLCGHGEASHDPGSQGRAVCTRCALSVRPIAAPPSHRFESSKPSNIARPVSGALGSVSAYRVGDRFTLRMREYVVLAPCGTPNVENGEWVCVTHVLRFENNMDRDQHCLFTRSKDGNPHRLVWNCYEHGPEMGGVA